MKQSSIDKANQELKLSGYDASIIDNTAVYVKGNIRVDIKCNSCQITTSRKLTALMRGVFSCEGCHAIKIKTLLDYSELTLKSETNKTVTCMCNVCGSIKELGKTLLYGGKIQCKQCQFNKYITIADKYNFEFIKYENKEVHLSCRTCATTTILPNSSRLTGCNVYCKTCSLANIGEIPAPIGYTILKQDDSGVLLSCQSCGYWKKVTHFKAINSKHKCDNCRTIKCEEALKARACRLLYREWRDVYYINSLGEVRTNKVSEICSGKFSQMAQSSWSNPTSVYMIVCKFDGNYFCKIGTATDPEKRLKVLKLDGDTYLHIIGRYADRYTAVKVEHDFHKILEPYKIPPRVAIQFSNNKNDGITADGVTEWFDSYAIYLLEGWMNHGVNRYSED